MTDTIEGLPPEALVPVWWVRQEWRSAVASITEAVRTIGAREASGLLRMDPRKLRRRSAKWEREMLSGIRPRVRVYRDGPRKRYRYDETDVLALAGLREARMKPASEDDEVDAIVARLLAEDAQRGPGR